jgi:hypothetical protein
MRRKGYIVQNGIEYVVNKQDVVKLHQGDKKILQSAGNADRWKGEHEDKGNYPSPRSGERGCKTGQKRRRTTGIVRANYGRKKD